MHKVCASVFAVLCACSHGIVTQAQDRPRTSSELVRLALERNRDFLAARQQAVEAQGLLRRAGLRPNPTVELGAGTGRPLGTRGEEEFSAGYFHPFETAGKRGKRLDAGQHGVAAAEADIADRARQLTFDVRTRIAETKAAQQKRDALARLLTASQESYQLTKARVAEGDAAALEEQLLLMEVRRLEAQQATFAGRAASALLALLRTLGLPAGEPLALADEHIEGTEYVLADLTTQALVSRPDLRVARAAEGQTGAEVALARAEGVPDLTISATYSRRQSAFERLFGTAAPGTLVPLVDRDHVLAFGLSIPLYGPGRNRGNLDAAQARATASRLHREYLEGAIAQEVDAAYQRWLAARRTIEVFRRGLVDQSRKNLEVVRQAYTLGQLRLVDVLTEHRRLIDTELAYIDAQTELAEAAADLQRAVGSDLP